MGLKRLRLPPCLCPDETGDAAEKPTQLPPSSRTPTLPALGLEAPPVVSSPPKAPQPKGHHHGQGLALPGQGRCVGQAPVSLNLYQRGCFVAQRSGVGREAAAGVGGALVGVAGSPPDGDMRAC